jgi:hypothetical protein
MKGERAARLDRWKPMQGRPTSPQPCRGNHLARLSAAIGIALAAGCSEEPQEAGAVRSVAKEPPAIHRMERLVVTEGPSPARWLASRQAGRDLPEEDPLVAEYARMLESAGRRFREYPRMIANRAVQLEEMLAEKNMPEAAPRIIEELSAIPGDTRYVESFGALCQQYYNLRLQGLERAEALKLLKTGGSSTN